MKGDVGHSEREEMTVLPPAPLGGGKNLGWRKFEGTRTQFGDYLPSATDPAIAWPHVEYSHNLGTSACIIGGYSNL